LIDEGYLQQGMNQLHHHHRLKYHENDAAADDADY
jgi:hypothetical protein